MKAQSLIPVFFFIIVLHVTGRYTGLAQDQMSEPKWEKVTEGPKKEEDKTRYAIYLMLRGFLPAGTRMTSGYRSSETQLALVGREATRRGIPVPEHWSLDDEQSWMPVFIKLRNTGFQVSSPKAPLHGVEDNMVFDLSGANLNAIERGIKIAEGQKWVFGRNYKEGVNNCFHVEVISYPAKYLNKIKEILFSSSKATGESQVSTLPTSQFSAVDLNEAGARRIRDLYEKSKDLEKKIDYADELKQLLPLSDPGRGVLDKEVDVIKGQLEKQKNDALQNVTEAEKQKIEKNINDVLLEGKFDDAEHEVDKLKKLGVDAQAADSWRNSILAQKYLSAAENAYFTNECSECKEASRLIDEAVKYAEKDLEIQRLKVGISEKINNCWWKMFMTIGLGVFFSSIAIVGLYFLFLPGKWVLEGIDGSCRGELFPLDKEQILIGALGPPDGEADIVISDKRYKISRSHCVIRRVGRKYYLQDKSANGTKVNGQEVSKVNYHLLRKGDEISLADAAEFLFRRV